MEEIRQLAPGYRGKPENFDPKKVGQKVKPKTKSPLGPKSPRPTPSGALHKNENTTEQKNDLLLAESIFGVDVTIVAVEPVEDFSTTFAQLPEIAVETYNQCAIDVRQLNRVLVNEEMSYYATGPLWLKLTDVKAKKASEALTSEERSIRKATEEMEFSVPQPVSAFLHQIGQFSDKMGKTTDLKVPSLPTQRAQGMGGYHSPAITEETRNLVEDVPSLGIAGDMVMALCQDGIEPMPNFKVQIPEGAMIP